LKDSRRKAWMCHRLLLLLLLLKWRLRGLVKTNSRITTIICASPFLYTQPYNQKEPEVCGVCGVSLGKEKHSMNPINTMNSMNSMNPRNSSNC
jgi:hypothetical protein